MFSPQSYVLTLCSSILNFTDSFCKVTGLERPRKFLDQSQNCFNVMRIRQKKMPKRRVAVKLVILYAFFFILIWFFFGSGPIIYLEPRPIPIPVYKILKVCDIVFPIESNIIWIVSDMFFLLLMISDIFITHNLGKFYHIRPG